MGRRGNRNNKNRGRTGAKLARKKFKRNVCTKCQLCDAETHMRICYNKLYIRDPEVFMDVVLPSLIEHHAELKDIKDVKDTPTAEHLQMFKEIFCDAEICAHCKGTTTKALEVCFTSFLAQTKKSASGQAKKLKDSATPPVMTTIISNNDAFEREILHILDEYKNKKRSATRPQIENHDRQHD